MAAACLSRKKGLGWGCCPWPLPRPPCCRGAVRCGAVWSHSPLPVDCTPNMAHTRTLHLAMRVHERAVLLSLAMQAALNNTHLGRQLALHSGILWSVWVVVTLRALSVPVSWHLEARRRRARLRAWHRHHAHVSKHASAVRACEGGGQAPCLQEHQGGSCSPFSHDARGNLVGSRRL